MFMGIRYIYRDAVLEMIRERNLKTLFDDCTVMVYMSKEDALKLTIDMPEGVEMKSLVPGDAEKVNSVWPHASEGSVEFLQYCITYNRSVGIYDHSELVAWCLEHDYYCLLALQVDADHLRKGYGTLVTKAITKKIAEQCDADVITNIVTQNSKSKALFKKAGFKDIDTNSWIGLIEQ
jgi:RimJ/RimL family protein N-acetyltransferase